MPTTAARKRTYKPVLDLPPLSAEERDGLRASIALHGVLVPIMLAEDGRIIDGSNRKQIADELGIDCPEVVQAGLDEEEIRALARSLNLARRQLSREQRRQLVADQLRETPGWSNRRVAKALGVDHHTVASVRLELEPTGEILQLDHTTGLDGKARPATRVVPVVHRGPAGDPRRTRRPPRPGRATGQDRRHDPAARRLPRGAADARRGERRSGSRRPAVPGGVAGVRQDDRGRLARAHADGRP